MKIRVLSNEIAEGKIEFVSLVKHGANRSAFKIVKTDEKRKHSLDDRYAELDKTLAKLAGATNRINNQETNEMKTVERDQRAIDRERQKLNILHGRLEDLWASRDTPGKAERETMLLGEIEKSEIALASLGHEQPNVVEDHSAFFHRGGVTGVFDCGDVGDNTMGVRKTAAIRKATATIDLSDTGMGISNTNYNEIDDDLGFKI